MRSLYVLGLLIGPFCTTQAQDGSSVKVRTAQEALRTAPRAAWSERAADLATAFRAAEMLDSARGAADRAVRYALTDEERARAHFALARVLLKQQNNLGAQEHARQTIMIARAARDTAMLIRGEAMLAEVDMAQDRFSAARTHVELVHQLALAQKDTSALSSVHTYLGNMFYREGNYDSARWHYDQSIAFIPPTDSLRRLLVNINQVNLFIEEGRYDSALARSDAMRGEVEMSNAEVRSKYYNQRGYAFFSAGRYRDAIPEFTRSDSINSTYMDQLDLRIENTGFLAESYAGSGDSAKGYLLMLDLEVLKDSFAAAAADERMLKLEKQFETRLSKEEIERLNNENQQKAERLQVQMKQLLGSLIIAGLAIGAVLLVWRLLRQKRKYAAELEGLNMELTEQQERIEEINRLLQLKVLRTQMDPHFIHNCLNAIKSLSLSGEHEKAEEYLDGFARLLRTVLEHSVRDRIALEEEIEFLRDYEKLEELRLQGRFTWTITADQSLLDEGAMIPSLMVQPFVENAIWHGLAPKPGAKHLTVHFSASDHGVRCIIEDNGVGRDAARSARVGTATRSRGLQLTGERLELLTDHLNDKGDVHFEDLKEDAGQALGTRVELNLRDAVR